MPLPCSTFRLHDGFYSVLHSRGGSRIFEKGGGSNPEEGIYCGGAADVAMGEALPGESVRGGGDLGGLPQKMFEFWCFILPSRLFSRLGSKAEEQVDDRIKHPHFALVIDLPTIITLL